MDNFLSGGRGGINTEKGDARSMQVTITSDVYPRAAFNTRYQHLLNISLSEAKVLYIKRDQENGQQVNHFPSGKKRSGGKTRGADSYKRKNTRGGRKKRCETSQIGRE